MRTWILRLYKLITIIFYLISKVNIFIKIVQSLDNSTSQMLLIQFYEEKQIDRLQEYLEKLHQNEEITEVIRKRLLLEAEKAVKE